MYSITSISKLTGLSAYTLRYYEKIGILQSPKRVGDKENGRRQYDEEDLQYILFINGLKQTGMKLEDIAKFTQDGCLLTINDSSNIDSILVSRISILDIHIEQLEQKLKQINAVKEAANEKRTLYKNMLQTKSMHYE